MHSGHVANSLTKSRSPYLPQFVDDVTRRQEGFWATSDYIYVANSICMWVYITVVCGHAQLYTSHSFVYHAL